MAGWSVKPPVAAGSRSRLQIPSYPLACEDQLALTMSFLPLWLPSNSVSNVSGSFSKPSREALEAALGVFWRKGYEGTSYADLVAATGVERTALYSAFGNKAALFLRALERYATHYGEYVWDALNLKT